MEVLAIESQAAELYDNVFAQEVEEGLDGVESHPDFSVSGIVYKTITKAIIVYAKCVKGEEAKVIRTTRPVHLLYSRERETASIKEVFTAVFKRAVESPPEGYTFTSMGVKIVTADTGLFANTVRTTPLCQKDVAVKA